MKTGILGILIAYIIIICKLIVFSIVKTKKFYTKERELICDRYRKSIESLMTGIKEIYAKFTKNPVQELVKDLESDYDDLDDEII